MRKTGWKSGKAGALKGPATLDQVRADVSYCGLVKISGHPVNFVSRLSKRNARKTYSVKPTLERAEVAVVVVVDVRKWAAVTLASSPEVVNLA